MTSSLLDCVRIADRSLHSPVILHVPHASRYIPKAFISDFVVSEQELALELDAMTDHFTDELAKGISNASYIASELSRFVVDVERFPDEREEMLEVGMGAFYTHGSRRQLIRKVSESHQAQLMDYFLAYSRAFEDLVTATLKHHGKAIILDIHSFPENPLPYELHSEEVRHGIIIGTSGIHTPQPLREEIQEAFSGIDVGFDTAFKGAYVPLSFYESEDAQVRSAMLEIRRDLYMDESTVTLLEPDFSELELRLSHLVNNLQGKSD